MEEQKRACKSCGVENESEYDYCKNCGALLEPPHANVRQPQNGYAQPFTGAQQTFAGANSAAQSSAQQFPASGGQQYSPQSPFCGAPGQNPPSAGGDCSRQQPSGQTPPSDYGQTAYQTGGQYQGVQYSQNANRAYSDGFAPFYPQQGHMPFEMPPIDGIPAEDMAIFVGKNASVYLPKFAKMELTGNKAAWLWAPALLSFFFGAFGAACWFFYRKMPKIAVILLTAGMVLSIAKTALEITFVPDIADRIAYMTENIFGEDFSDGDGDYFPDETYPAPDETEHEPQNSLPAAVYNLLTPLQTVINLTLAIVFGLFGCRIYKKKAVKSIRKYQAGCVNPQYYRFGLAATGGTSGGLVAVGIIVPIFLTFAATVALILAIIGV